MFLEKFLIHELAERAQTTIRTIRYYTDEGLLPQPVLHGKYAYYTPSHLNRLELIRRMKDAYLPLREIRQIMISLSDEEVELRLNENTQPDSKAELQTSLDQSAKVSGSKALEYISQVMEQQSHHRPKDLQVGVPVLQSSQAGAVSQSKSQPARIPVPRKPVSEGETWQRISLKPGVELSLREPVSLEDADRVQQLITFANKLFQ